MRCGNHIEPIAVGGWSELGCLAEAEEKDFRIYFCFKEEAMRGGTRSRGIFALVGAILLLLSVAPWVSAQVTGGSMSGTVTDGTGAAVAGAKILIKNTDTGITRETTTDSAGYFSAPNLTAGPYSVTTSATGFATAVRSGIVLTVGADQVLNTAMQVGQITQQVEVTTEAPTVQLSSSSLSGEVQATTVRGIAFEWPRLDATCHAAGRRDFAGIVAAGHRG